MADPFKEIRFLLAVGSKRPIKKIASFFQIVFWNVVGASLEGFAYCFVILAFSKLIGGEPKGMGQGLIERAFSLFWDFGFEALLLFAVVAQVAKSSACFLAVSQSAKLSSEIQNDVQRRVNEQIFSLSFPCVNRYKIGELAEFARAPLNFIRPFMEALNQVLASLAIIAVSGLLLLLLSPILTFIILFLFALAMVAQKFLISKTESTSCKLAREMEAFTAQTVQNLSAIRQVHLFNRQGSVLEKISTKFKSFSHLSKRLTLLQGLIGFATEVISMGLIALTLFIGYRLIAEGEGSGAALLLGFITITYRLAVRVQIAMSQTSIMAGYKGHVSSLERILSPSDKEFLIAKGASVEGFEKSLVFDKLSFRYPGVEEWAISDFSFEIAKGSFVGIVGASGAGKSSLLDLLSGLFAPTSGIFSSMGRV